MFKKFIVVFLLLGIMMTGSCKKADEIVQKVLPTIQSFTADPTEIDFSQPSTLSWNVSGATAVNISGIGDVQQSGTREVSPAETTTYTLTAINADGSRTQDVTVTVNPSAWMKLLTANKSYASYGSPRLRGSVKNIGNRTAYSVVIKFYAYDDNDTKIETAYGFPADLGDIPPGSKATYEAVFIWLSDWNEIAKVLYEINWRNRAGYGFSETNSIESVK